jgi:hypothetical protein
LIEADGRQNFREGYLKFREWKLTGKQRKIHNGYVN